MCPLLARRQLHTRVDVKQQRHANGQADGRVAQRVCRNAFEDPAANDKTLM